MKLNRVVFTVGVLMEYGGIVLALIQFWRVETASLTALVLAVACIGCGSQLKTLAVMRNWRSKRLSALTLLLLLLLAAACDGGTLTGYTCTGSGKDLKCTCPAGYTMKVEDSKGTKYCEMVR